MYADWITDVGAALGFDCLEDDSAGEWIGSEMTVTRAIDKAIRRAALDGIEALDGDLQTKFGFSASDVFLQSINTGDSMGQSYARLHSRNRGLKPVRWRGLRRPAPALNK